MAPHAVIAPDGGWGWIIAGCSHVNQAFLLGSLTSLSVFYVSWFDEFGTEKSTISWIISICISMMFLSGPIAGSIASKAGYRLTTIFGGLLACIGLLLSSFSTSVVYLVFTIGIITGFGYGLVYLSSFANVVIYFDKRRALAISIATSGAGVGSFVMAPLMNTLTELYGWRGALFVAGGIILNLCVTGMLMRPLKARRGFGSDKGEKRKCLSSVSENGLKETTQTELEIDNVTRMDEERRKVSTCNNEHDSVSDRVGGYYKEMRSVDEKNPEDVNTAELMETGVTLSSSAVAKGNTKNRTVCETVNTLLEESSSCKPYVNTILDSSKNEERVINKSNTESVMSCRHSDEPDRDVALIEEKSILLYYITADNNNPGITQSEQFRKRSSLKNHRKRHIMPIIHQNLDVMRNPVFIFIAISQVLICLSSITPIIYVVDRAMHNGIAKNTAVWLVSIYGIGSISGRLFFGMMADKYLTNHLLIYIVILKAGGISTMLSPLCGGNVVLNVIYVAFFGYVMGGVASLVILVVVDLMGVDRLATSLGLSLWCAGLGHLLGAPFGGFVHDSTGSYTMTYVFQGLFLALSGITLLPVYYRKKKRKSKEMNVHVEHSQTKRFFDLCENNSVTR